VTSHPAISEELVRACYQVFLGRPPENQAVIAEKLRCASVDELLRSFAGSPEALRRFPEQLRTRYLAPLGRIDVDVTPDVLDQMFQRIRREWTVLGEADPFWSVITMQAYRSLQPDDPAVAAFIETGRQTAALIDVFAQRSGYVVPGGVCLELGAGVGRVTRHLAGRFERVVAVEVSRPSLQIAERILGEAGVKNVEFVLLESPDDVHDLPRHDVFFSTIVLQHNPPPMQKYILDCILPKISGGGAALAQIPTHTPEYSFSVEQYLQSDAADMEMHCLPMPVVFSLLEKHGLRPGEVLMDHWTGLYGSHTFFAVKTGAGPAPGA
jgi:predicted O-methyltransferase YrrM